MNDYLRSLRDLFVSLKLTVALLIFGMILIFAATLDQVNLGIWAVQEKYFRSFIVYTRIGDVALPVFPGGYLIGGLLLTNLTAAHIYRFTLSWRKTGIFLAHVGLILLLVGELLSGLWQQDYSLRLAENETKSYSESFRDHELVIIDTTDATTDEVVAIPEALLAKKRTIQHPKLPFRVATKTYYPNSVLQARKADSAMPAEATAGFGERIFAAPQPVTYKPDEINLPTAFVEITAPDRSLGTWLVSAHLVMPQEFEYDGRKWKIMLRIARLYHPFSLKLLKVTHEVYPGTQIPKNFSSRVHLKTPDGRDDREVLVFMNNPMRYGGYTFYQHQMNAARGETGLQVVRNPSWLLPYIACALMSLGLVVQFGIHLVGFVVRRRPARDGRDASAAPAQSLPALTSRATSKS